VGEKEERGAKTRCGAGELERESSRWTGPFYRESANSASEPSALSSGLGGGLTITRPTEESSVRGIQAVVSDDLSLGTAPSH
jgi:hypothetical protein